AEASAQQPAPMRIRGELVAVDAASITVKRKAGGDVKIAIKPDQAVSAVKKVALADVKPGSYVGIATKNSGGKLVALEVLVFPEAGRGTGEGHYEWDLAPGSMMTNANVDTVVNSVDGRTLKLSYKGGSKEITVPENAPVVTPTSASRADLVPGKKVFVIANGDPANLTAARVYVEKDGVAPPM
ncbi:MAG TPA: hypothetical protein VNS31_12775, partial [Ramlibacter sp.]|nr:hypothetical protein [Ramlibacter sp.]